VVTKTGVKMQPNSHWKILDKDQLKTLDDAAFEILRDVGMMMEDDEVLRMAQNMGCTVDFEKKIVRNIPESIVRKNMEKAPRNFVLAGRDPEWDMIFEGAGKTQFWGLSNGATDRLVYNEVTKTYSRQRASCKDIAYAVRIGDGLDDFDNCARLFDAAEEGQAGLPLEVDRMNTVLQNTVKHAAILTTTANDDREYDYVEKLAAIVSGDSETLRKRPLWMSIYNPLGLHLNKFNSRLLRMSIKHHFPMHCGTVAAAPLMGPATAAANTAIAHGSNLWMTAFQQEFDPGAVALNNNIVLTLDPFTGGGNLPSSHAVVGAVAMNQLWHELYGLPVQSYHGTGTFSLDQIMFCEGVDHMSLSLMGTDLIHPVWMTGAMDPAIMPAIAEMAHYFKHMWSNFDQIYPTKENLILDLIKNVGPSGEGWMTSEFNMARIDTFYKTFNLANQTPDMWLREGAKSWLYDLCREKLKELEKHEPKPLPPDVVARMNAVQKEADTLLKMKR
jgi:trimethylamine:corrinoid methyltransferase-like protein